MAGLVGGYLYTQAFPMEGAVTAVDAAATGIGAFVGSVLANNVLGLIRVGSARPRG
ncbi:MAG: hypothetical protein GY719_12370 [bacterium]|nr:hypothetical protein [bacterium]